MFGRGGAGNIIAQEGIAQRSNADLESGSSNRVTESTYASGAKRAEQQYAHSGRGGAGNYYSPREQSQTGTFSADKATASDSATSMETTVAKKHGRGGAGNYEFRTGEANRAKAQREEQETEKEKTLQHDIQKDVGEQLAFPSKAKLRERKRPY